MKVAKYEFNSKEQFQEKFKALHKEDGIPFTISELGYRTLEEAIYNDEGLIIKAAVKGTKWHVDALLESHPEGWESYSINIDSEGMHSFLGVSYLKNKL